MSTIIEFRNLEVEEWEDMDWDNEDTERHLGITKDDSDIDTEIVDSELLQDSSYRNDTESDPVDIWKRELRSKGIRLNKAEQNNLVQLAQAGNKEAANWLTYSVFGLIQKHINTMGKKMFGYEEALSIAMSAVAKGINTYDEDHAGKSGATASVSTHISNHIRWTYLNEYRKRKRIRKYEKLSLDYTDTDGNKTVEAESDSPSPFALAIATEHRVRICSLLEYLDDQDAEITALRFGLHDNVVRTLQEVGEQIGLTKERVRQRLIRVLGIVSGILDQKGLVPESALIHKLKSTKPKLANTLRHHLGTKNPFEPKDRKSIAKIMNCDEETVRFRKRYAHEKLIRLTQIINPNEPALSAIEYEETQSDFKKPFWSEPTHLAKTSHIESQLTALDEALDDPAATKILRQRWGVEDGEVKTHTEVSKLYSIPQATVAVSIIQNRIHLLRMIIANDPHISAEKKIYIALMSFGIHCETPMIRKMIYRMLDADNVSEILPAFWNLSVAERESLAVVTGLDTGIIQGYKEVEEKTGTHQNTVKSRVRSGLQRMYADMNLSMHNHFITQKLRTGRTKMAAIYEYLDKKEILLLQTAIEQMHPKEHQKDIDAFTLRTGLLDGMVHSYKEISEKTGISEKQVGIRIQKLLPIIDRILLRNQSVRAKEKALGLSY